MYYLSIITKQLISYLSIAIAIAIAVAISSYLLSSL